MTTLPTTNKLARKRVQRDQLRSLLAELRVHRSHGGGNPYHDAKGKFASGGGGSGRKALTPAHRKQADDFRTYAHGEQKEQHGDHKAARKEQIRDQKAEHHALRREQSAERKALPKEHAGELKELDRDHARDRKEQARDHEREKREQAKDHAKEHAELDKDHARENTPDGERKAAKQELSDDHARYVQELHESHESDRAGMIESQRIEREHYTQTHADAIAEQKQQHKEARDDQRKEFKDSRKELRGNHVEERKELRGRLRDEFKELKSDIHADLKGGRPASRSLSPVKDRRFGKGKTLKANSAEMILKVCLRNLGLGKAFRKGELTGQERLELLGEIRSYGCAWLHHEAAAFLAANTDGAERSLTGAIGQHASRLFGRMKGFIRELYVAGSMALLGPRALTESELKAIDVQHQVQVQYFDRFQEQLGQQHKILNDEGTVVIVGPEPDQALDGTFASRAEQYGASVWGSAQEVARASAADVLRVERRRHTRKDEPCVECVEQLGLEWQPVGTLKRIGECECLNHCHCFFEFKVHPDDERTYLPGEFPDNAGEFGSTEIHV